MCINAKFGNTHTHLPREMTQLTLVEGHHAPVDAGGVIYAAGIAVKDLLRQEGQIVDPLAVNRRRGIISGLVEQLNVLES